jgi:hypothetical protein
MMDELSNIKSSLQDNIWNAYEFGIQLPEGCVAFYDEHKKCFVDGGSLKPLEGEFAVMAAEAFAALPRRQQENNTSYFTFCALYSDVVRREENQVASAFNSATHHRRTGEAEPVADIIRRVFSSLLAPKF